MDLSQVSNEMIAGVVTILLSLLGGGGAAVKVYVPKITQFIRDVSSAAASVQGMSEQFKNNGGSTMKDALDGLQKSVLRIEQRQIMGEQRTKAVMNSNTDVGYFETNEKGECLWASRGYLRLVGRSLEDVTGNGWIGVIAPEDRKRVVEEWHDAVEQSRDFQAKYQMIGSDGQKIPVICVSSVMRNDAKLPVGHVGTVTILADGEKYSTREDGQPNTNTNTHSHTEGR